MPNTTRPTVHKYDRFSLWRISFQLGRKWLSTHNVRSKINLMKMSVMRVVYGGYLFCNGDDTTSSLVYEMSCGCGEELSNLKKKSLEIAALYLLSRPGISLNSLIFRNFVLIGSTTCEQWYVCYRRGSSMFWRSFNELQCGCPSWAGDFRPKRLGSMMIWSEKIDLRKCTAGSRSNPKHTLYRSTAYVNVQYFRNSKAMSRIEMLTLHFDDGCSTFVSRSANNLRSIEQ